ncbi:hypothetical protein JOF28_000055 [Leucobacter exalbidus]|uniref:Uncharacterized protein n=1 Tax=Leucobacter exalbidus TaxID=662960 RepID=A0A940PQE7_9MICO|nr:hypothetical protein [Leucobacter exalbidus]MBP1324823.1 hypothetical protein [Leucobacter exalbidus]
MAQPAHGRDPKDNPTRAQRREYYRGIPEREAARNGMTLAEYKKYASMSGETSHKLHQPVGLIVTAAIISVLTGAIVVTAIVQWALHQVNLLESIWVIVLVLVALSVSSWFYAFHEMRTARNRRNDGVTLRPSGHAATIDGPDPGGPVI